MRGYLLSLVNNGEWIPNNERWTKKKKKKKTTILALARYRKIFN